MRHAIRGSFFDLTDDPFSVEESSCIRYIEDGLLVIENGKIADFGIYNDLRNKHSALNIVHYPDRLIMPGFIDIHVHYPQLEIIASYGKQLLDWLEDYVYPTECLFSSEEHSQNIASCFLDQLISNGTTTALVFTTTSRVSADAFFKEAGKRNLRMIAGKVMMDRNAPKCLLETPVQSRNDNEWLIKKWHGKGRLSYAVTPRFAITCTPEMLRLAGDLKNEHSGVYIHTHLAENVDEVKKTLELFPDCSSYLDIYDEYGMVSDKSVFAHGIYLKSSEFKRLSEAKATIAFCPASNLFLGSGLFKIHKAKSRKYPVQVGLATDIGAGTSLSQFRSMSEAYKIAQLQKQNLSVFKLLYLATLGAAKGLSLDDKIGNFDKGKEADFIVLDLAATPILRFRNRNSSIESKKQLEDKLFAAMMLGDDWLVKAVHIMGQNIHNKMEG